MRYVRVEDVVLMHLEQLFPSFKLSSQGTFRIIRDSEMEIDEETDDWARTFESALKQRRCGSVVCLTVAEKMPLELREFVREQLAVPREDVHYFVSSL